MRPLSPFLIIPLLAVVCAAAPAAPPQPTAAPHWIKMPFVSPVDARAGIKPGGEGGQWPRGPIAVSPADPDFLLLPIDVGGLYRSLDGGRHWESAMTGWDARGANGFAIDPRNASHVLGIGSNSMEWNPGWGPSPHGVYLSGNKAASWTHVLAAPDGVGGAVAFDPHSFDPAQNVCRRAYFLSLKQGLFASDDGGQTWRFMSQGDFSESIGRDWTEGGGVFAKLRVDANGVVYIGGGKGLFCSDDRGKTFRQVRANPVFGLSLAPNGAIFVSGAPPEPVAVSRDGGATWAALPCRGLETQGGKPVQDLAVSPADPRRMLVWVAGDNWKWTRFVSQDGGQTFASVVVDKGAAPLPLNARQGYATWSPKDPAVAWSLGGDWVTKSSDGGKTFVWSNNGYNGIMAGGLFGFSPAAPDTVIMGVQDYNGAFTRDGGKTWTYADLSGKGWGGHEYGGLAANDYVMWVGDAESWGTPRRLRLTRDGGKTWAFVNGPDGKPLEWHGADVSFADLRSPKVYFASDLRSADAGATWERMTGCDGVYAASPRTGLLYGKKGNAVVSSADHGATWQKVTDAPGGLVDMAIDSVRGRIYVASEEVLKVWDGAKWTTVETPADQFGNRRVWTVATDPANPAVVYVGGPRNTYASHATVCRSLDGGATWQNLTVNAPLSASQPDGPHEVSCIRVHPRTHEAWVAGQCFGLWRIAPPARGAKGVSVAQASAPRAANPPTTTTLVSPVASAGNAR